MHVLYPAHDTLVLIALAIRACAFACSHTQNMIQYKGSEQTLGLMPRYTLLICLMGNFACFCRLLTFFFKNNVLEKNLSIVQSSVKQFGYRSGPTFCLA